MCVHVDLIRNRQYCSILPIYLLRYLSLEILSPIPNVNAPRKKGLDQIHSETGLSLVDVPGRQNLKEIDVRIQTD